MIHTKDENKGFIVTLGVFTIAVLTLGTSTTAHAQLQLNADTLCVLNPQQCDEARFQEFSDTMERAMQEAFEEDYEERTGEEVPTVDELMQDVREEGDFDDARLAEEAAENGIPDMENMPSADILNRPGDVRIEKKLL